MVCYARSRQPAAFMETPVRTWLQASVRACSGAGATIGIEHLASVHGCREETEISWDADVGCSGDGEEI